MNFLTPLAFTLAILIPIIIAMYLLKLRRTERVVSSTFLWQRMVRDVEANAPWQRLRRNLLLLLQLLFLITIIFALARPFVWVEGSSGAATILIVDVSASMAATDVAPNRLEAAKDQARLIISNLPEETRATLIAAGKGPQVLVSSSTDRRQILQALENLQPQPVSSDLISALELASAITSASLNESAARQFDSEIVILSDGRVALPPRLAILGRTRFLPIGERGNNQAITLLTLEPTLNGETLTAFAQVTNYADEGVQRRLTLSADNRLIDAHDLEILAHGQVSVISEIIPQQTEILEAALTEGDDLFLDDRAWAVQRTSHNRSITLASAGNRFLETALGLLPKVKTTVIGLEVLESKNQSSNQTINQSDQLTIFDSILPTSTLPTGNILFIGPITSTGIFSVTGVIEAINPRFVKDDDFLIAHVDLSQVSILDSARIPLPDWAQPVIVDEATGSPLLFAGEIEAQRIAVLAFDPRRSDLPLQPAYPILIANLVDWLLPGQIGDIPSEVSPGDVLTFKPPPEIQNLTVTRPDGSSTQLDVREGRVVYGETQQLGVYVVKWEAGRLGFAVNFSSPQELDIQPVKSLPLFEGMVTTDDKPLQHARREFWRPLAGLALIFICIEWLVYHRAILTKVRHHWFRS